MQQPTNYVMYDTKSEELTENIQAGDSIRIPIELDREDKWFSNKRMEIILYGNC